MYCISCPNKRPSPIRRDWSKGVNFLLSSSVGRREFREYIESVDDEILSDIELWETFSQMICRLLHSRDDKYTDSELADEVKNIVCKYEDNSSLGYQELKQLKELQVADRTQCVKTLQSAQQGIASKLEPYYKNFLKKLLRN